MKSREKKEKKRTGMCRTEKAIGKNDTGNEL